MVFFVFLMFSDFEYFFFHIILGNFINGHRYLITYIIFIIAL